ncbi:MAG: radical SAM protein [Spirochaetaceae bacterium]|nr:MAG: radical SAM protein [Spirochaetaceae bacterium]
MGAHEIQAKSILIKRKYIDSWFVSRYGMNLYRGCQHNCAYCDGRAEGYYVDGEFGRDVCVKVNAPEILRRELDPARRRKPLKGGYFLLGGGVGDSYQRLEETYYLSRQALEILAEFGYPVQVLTKSTLVRRDLDLLQRINRQSRAIVCFSLSSVDERISRIYEPGVPSPGERLEILKLFKIHGIPTALFLLPVIPFISDTEELLERALQAAAETEVDYLIFGGMTLKEGRQSSYFLNTLSRHQPEFVREYREIYRGERWGQASGEYYRRLHSRFWRIMRGESGSGGPSNGGSTGGIRGAGTFRIPLRMPPELFGDLLDDKDRIVVILDQMDYLFQLRGKASAYGSAARAVARWDGPLSDLIKPGIRIRGISGKAAAVIGEILECGTAREYERLLRYSMGVSSELPHSAQDPS